MILCDVVGSVVSTIKIREHDGRKIMLVQPVSPAGEKEGAVFLALDMVGCGPGERVIVNKEGGSSRIAFGDETAGVHSTITGIVD
jgi:microcompartment protein CcmK/EutM